MTILAGDVGGTNTRLALFEGERLVARIDHPSVALDGLAGAIRTFLEAQGARPAAGCIGVAGPVRRGRARLTNLEWHVDAVELTAALGFPVRLINDFHAQAAAVAALAPDDVEQIGGGAPEPDAPVAVVGPGTGLGEAIVIPLPGGGRHVLPTEGGHARYAPRDEREIGLLRFLWEQYPEHVSVERVLSGPGLVAIYDYLRGDRPRHPDMARLDPAAVVTRLALEGACPICDEALDIFVGVLGDEAANLALKCNAAGGVYVAGGIAPRLVTLLRDGRLREAFVEKGRFRRWLEAVPLYVIVHPDPGLLGARLEAEALVAGAAAPGRR